MTQLFSIQTICNHCAILFICLSFANSFRLQILHKRSFNFGKSRTKRETDVELGKVRHFCPNVTITIYFLVKRSYTTKANKSVHYYCIQIIFNIRNGSCEKQWRS